MKWSKAEKRVANRVFEAAWERECAALLERLRDLVSKAKDAEDIWKIHTYLSKQRKSLDAKYDYRYSQLIMVFGQLLREKWIEEHELEGLNEEKLELIREYENYLNKRLGDISKESESSPKEDE